MKKIYLKPNTEVINVKLQQMIAGSLPLGDTPTIDDASDILSRENDLLNFDDDNLVDF